MKRTFICFLILIFTTLAAGAGQREEKTRTVELMLRPAKAPQPKDKYQLLPKPEEQTDADAIPLYKKAIQSLPKDFQRDKIRQWIDTPLDEFPQEQVEVTIKQLKPALQLAEQAAKCKQCNWPPFHPGGPSENLNDFRNITYVLALQARLQIAKGQHEQAISTIKTGLTMARHLAEAPTVVHGLLGIAIGALTLKPTEQLIQAPDAPNLYWALQDLPKPFIDLTKQLDYEDESVEERVRIITKRLNRHIAALQCIEALRLYAAAHEGKFPDELADITEVTIPDDPVTEKPFAYSRAGSKAVLESPAPKGAGPRDAMCYELTLKE